MRTLSCPVLHKHTFHFITQKRNSSPTSPLPESYTQGVVLDLFGRAGTNLNPHRAGFCNPGRRNTFPALHKRSNTGRLLGCRAQQRLTPPCTIWDAEYCQEQVKRAPPRYEIKKQQGVLICLPTLRPRNASHFTRNTATVSFTTHWYNFKTRWN